MRGGNRRKPRVLEGGELRRFIRAYQDGVSCDLLRQRFKVSEVRQREILAENGIEVRGKGARAAWDHSLSEESR